MRPTRLVGPPGFFRQEYWSGLPCPPSKGSSQPTDWTQVSCIAGRFFTLWATREAQEVAEKWGWDLFKKIRVTMGTFHAKMGSIKGRNCRDLTEAEDIKKRWQEYTEEPYKKDLYNQDNLDGMITHLEPDILECEVKWALENITTNKASGGDGIPGELFQILKDDAVKVLHSICQQIWKTQQWLQPGKGQFSFQSQRKAMPKNAQTTTQLHSSHALVK